VNKYVAPHQLISISTTSNKHPDADKKLAVIVHRAGAVEVEVPKGESSGDNYKMFVTEGSSTENWD